MIRPNDVVHQSKDNVHKLNDIRCAYDSETIILPPSPSQSMLAFDKGLEPGACFVDERLLSVNGWLAPDGILYTCRWREHDLAISLFDVDSRFELLAKGYVPLSQMRFNLKHLSNQVNLQVFETIQSWHKVNNLNSERFDRDHAKWEAIHSSTG